MWNVVNKYILCIFRAKSRKKENENAVKGEEGRGMSLSGQMPLKRVKVICRRSPKSFNSFKFLIFSRLLEKYQTFVL